MHNAPQSSQTTSPIAVYGAYGFTGRLIVEALLARGHAPVLAGRSAAKVALMGGKLGLPHRALALNGRAALDELLEPAEVLINAAGPFIHTYEPLVAACLRTRTHYLDITGEQPVYQKIYAHDELARATRVSLIPGMGFDVVPTDCLAAFAAGRVREPSLLEIAIAPSGHPSAGTLKTMLEHFSEGAWQYTRGRLEPLELAADIREAPFNDTARHVMTAPLADQLASHHHLGIPTIRTYLAMPAARARSLRRVVPLLQRGLRSNALKNLGQRAVDRLVDGPDAAFRQRNRSQAWVRVTNEQGQTAQAWLESIEAYRMTGLCAMMAAERLVEGGIPAGALSPSQAFGADFVLELPETVRYEALPQPA